MGIKLTQRVLMIVGVIILIIISSWSISGYFITTGYHEKNHDKFAKCLSEKGAIVYVSKYCGHCKHQKEMFGDSFKYINSVECTENQQLCQENGIRGVPSWIINGVKYEGVQSFERLSSLTDCPLS